MTARVCQVVVADAEQSVRSALRLVLSKASGLRAIRETNDASDLLATAAASPPDLVLVDWNLPGLRPDAVIAGLQARAPRAIVVVLSTRPELRSRALAAGADAFVSKSDDPTLLLATLQRLDWPAPS